MRLHSDLENSTPRGEPKNRQRKASLRQEFRQGCRVLISSLSWYLGQSRRSAPPNARLTEQFFDGGFCASVCTKGGSGNLSGAAVCYALDSKMTNMPYVI